MIELRDYQTDMLTSLLGEIEDGKRPVGVLPTGGGKTAIFAEMTRMMAEAGFRVIIFAHTEELVMQSAATLGRLGVDCGVIKAGVQPHYSRAVQIASVQTLARMMKKPAEMAKIGQFDLGIMDEGHHATADSYKKIMAHPFCVAWMGFTATPQLICGKGLGEVYDAMVLGPTTEWLTEQGFLTPATVYAPARGVSMDGVGLVGGDFKSAESGRVMMADGRITEVVQHYLRHAKGKPTIAFVVTRQHGDVLTQELLRAGVRAAAIDGGMPMPARRAALDGLRDGTIEVVTSCEVLGEGVDVPGVECVIMARPTASLTKYLQQAGRGLRLSPGKDRCIILDHAGNTARHGFVTAERDWALDSKSRKKGDGSGQAPVRPCPACQQVLHASALVCSGCGYEFPRRVAQADTRTLVEMTPARKTLRNWKPTTWGDQLTKVKGATFLLKQYRGLFRVSMAPGGGYEEWLEVCAEADAETAKVAFETFLADFK